MATKKIGKQSISVRLNVGDEKHVNITVRTKGAVDARFNTVTNAVRYYVGLGIAAEKRVATGNDLGTRIIRETQREVFNQSLGPLTDILNGLREVMQEVREGQEAAETLANRTVLDLTGLMNKITQIGTRDLQNTLIVRSILFVYLLGFKTDRIAPDERTTWDNLIVDAHKRAQELAAQEAEAVSGGDAEIVRLIANDLFAGLKQFSAKTK